MDIFSIINIFIMLYGSNGNKKTECTETTQQITPIHQIKKDKSTQYYNKAFTLENQ